MWNKGDLYHRPESFPHIHSADLFGNDHPLELEVGSSTGEFLRALAASDQDANFVGVDVSAKVLYRAAEDSNLQGLDNIRFIRAPVQFTYRRLVEKSLRAVYLHYPDPNLRSRGQHQVFNPTFLDEMYRALVPGGRLSLISDHDALFEEMLSLSERDARFEKLHEERYLVGYEPEVKSRYQKLWEKHNVPPLRLELKKRES